MPLGRLTGRVGHVVNEPDREAIPAAQVDGRAGPRSIKKKRHRARQLPAYARPLFLRITQRLAATATFKHTKSDMQREGFDPTATSDPIYFDDPASKAFIRLDGALYAGLANGKVRL